MKSIIEFFQWFLERQIRVKNATCFLAALIFVAIVRFVLGETEWWQQMRQEYGIVVVSLVVFVGWFLAVYLAYSAAATIHQNAVSRRIAIERTKDAEEIVQRNLDTLTDWQRRFLVRFIVENRMQIPEFEVGPYKATWDFEMGVLIDKGIVKKHTGARVYEIDPIYYDYLKENWDPETGALG